MIKLFAADMDGTLLSPTHQITPETSEAITNLENLGTEFIVATGRNYQAAKALLDDFEINSALITANGAATYSKEGQLINSYPLSSEMIARLADFFERENLTYAAVTEKYYYVSDIERFKARTLIFFADNQAVNEQTKQQVNKYMENIKDFSKLSPDEETFLKFMAFDQSRAKLDQLGAKLAHWNLTITASSVDNLEISHPMANKGQAVKEYAHSQNISLNKIASIGDSDNDISMFEISKFSFAMNNADSSVKESAHQQVPSNNENGVATAINQLIQKEK